MRRREFIGLVGGAAVAWPRAVSAQTVEKVYRVGIVFPTSPLSEMIGPDPILPNFRAFLHGMRDLGYVEGRNLVLERRSAEGKTERFDAIVAELLGRNLDVLVTNSNELTQVAQRLTTTLPIVMATSFGPVEAGIVASLARPGGNVTGFAAEVGPEIEAKRLQILKEMLPDATRISVLALQDVWDGPQGLHVRAAAQSLGMTLTHAAHTTTNFSDAFALIAQNRPHALFVARHPVVYANRQLIAHFAVEQRLPGMYAYREIVEAGGLMTYGVDVTDRYRRTASYVDKILKGAKPADLPVQQPTKFELVLNLKTVKALGLTVPQALLAVADEVIE